MQPARRSPLGLRVCRGRPAGPLCAAGVAPGVGAAVGSPLSPDAGRNWGLRRRCPSRQVGRSRYGGLAVGAALSPPEQLRLQAPLRGILHQKDGGEGRGCCRRVLAFPGPCLSCLQIWSHICYVRTTIFLGRRNNYMPKSGRQVRVFWGKKPRKCRRFLLRSLLTVYLLAFLHLQNIFILDKSCGLILLRIISLNVAKV